MTKYSIDKKKKIHSVNVTTIICDRWWIVFKESELGDFQITCMHVVLRCVCVVIRDK